MDVDEFGDDVYHGILRRVDYENSDKSFSFDEQMGGIKPNENTPYEIVRSSIHKSNVQLHYRKIRKVSEEESKR